MLLPEPLLRRLRLVEDDPLLKDHECLGAPSRNLQLMLFAFLIIVGNP